MWNRYRKFKHVVVPAVLILAAYLIKGTPVASIVWAAALAIAAVLTLAYLTEEILWMRRGPGRPCPNCGQMVAVKSFRVRNQCAHCGHLL
jgi:hypothetical protein